ncbi:MAG: DUF5335 family protein [Longimicrobiales bacterium]
MKSEHADWTETLKEFTDRNAGRRTTLEIDSLTLGAQEEERDYPLKGVTFDHRDQRIQIMLGEAGSVSQHLTHSIEDAKRIDVVRRADGRDAALCIVHAGGQTLLRLH